MRVISKQISLESFTSRLPGVTPAYVPGHNEPIFFDEVSLSGREYTYLSNYGLVPMSVKINGVCLSWERISDLYHFFTDYNHLLKDWSHCGMVYTSATEYYKVESRNGYANQMVYGSSEQTYIDIENYYQEWKNFEGGVNACVPSMDIPSGYTDYWHSTKLFYPDYLKWKGWFTDRYSRYGSYSSISDCSGVTDCCDCTEYFNRGGNDMYRTLISTTFSIPSPTDIGNYCKPEMELPVSLQVSIDDIGEFSIFSEEYKLGTDYRTANEYGDTENTNGGTVVTISGEAKTLVDGAGFVFDQEYMEMKYDDSQWEEHKGDTVVNGVPEENEDVRYPQYPPAATAKYYGFDSDMVKKTGTTEDQVRQAIAGRYKVSPLNSILINLIPYDVREEEWGYYNGDTAKTFYVYRDEYTDTPYTVINGKKTYADILSKPTKSEYFYFPFFKTGTSFMIECGTSITIPLYKKFPRVRTGDTKNFITYNGTAYEINGNAIIINGSTYRWMIGEFTDEDGIHYVGKNGLIYSINVYYDVVEDSNYYVVEQDGDRYVKKNFENNAKVYEYGKVVGTAASKLTSLRSDATLVDDTGEPIEGKYNVSDKYNHQPPEGTILDLLYENGNTANMILIDKLNTGTTKYYHGDMITGMEFYYVDNAGSAHTKYSWSVSSLNTITGMTVPANTDSGTVWCDIEYVLGATWIGTKQKKDGLDVGMTYSPAGGEFSPGVKYNETVRFVKTQVQYNLALGKDGQIPTTMDSVSAHSLCYPVVCYILSQNIEEIESNYGTKYDYPVSNFKMTLPPASGWSGYSENVEVFPVFRQEYLFGSATMQNVDVDIYIDRGTNAAFEKHLKLGEVTSMEALENLGNGYYKMLEN